MTAGSLGQAGAAPAVRGPTATADGGVALALSGGAARAMAHIGVLKALEQQGRPPVLVAGTSSGALIAALYALSGSALEVERIVRSQDVAEVWRQAVDFGLHLGALISGRRLADWLDRKYFMGATFADTQLPLAVACTDLLSGRLVTLASGSISLAVRASCALPGIFAPVLHQGRPLIDGGFLEPIPFRALGAAPSAPIIGIQAGVDVERALMVRAIRRFDASAAGRALSRYAEATSGAGPVTQAVRGLSIALGSYSHDVPPPERATLLRVDPGIAWWDLHKSPQAIRAGQLAMQDLLSGGTVRL